MSNYFNYFTEIEETFVRRRGKSLLLSPLDWALMESWKDRGIPLHIVLRAIEHVFDVYDAQPNRKRTIKGLSYCKEEVEAQFAEWSEMQAGRGQTAVIESAEEGQFSKATVAEHIRKSVDAMKAIAPSHGGVLREALERAVSRLESLLQTEENTEKIEASLAKIDDLVDDAIIQQADSNERAEVERQLVSYKASMETEAYDRTLRLMLVKRLREASQVPRVSLFYL